MDLVKKYYEIQKELMELEPSFTDKGKINLVRRKTNEIFNKVAEVSRALLQLSIGEKETLKGILANEEQRAAYEWFVYFSNRMEFRLLLNAMHIMGKHLRTDDTNDIVRSHYHGYQVNFSFLPIKSLFDKNASRRVLELICNIGFICANSVILEDLLDALLLADIVDGEVIEPTQPAPEPIEGEPGKEEGNKKKAAKSKGPSVPVTSPADVLADIRSYAKEKPEFQKINAVVSLIARGAGNPLGDFHNLLEIYNDVRWRFLQNNAPDIGNGWAPLPDDKEFEIDYKDGRIFVQSSFDDQSMPVFVLEWILYNGILSIMFQKKVGKGFETTPEFLRFRNEFTKAPLVQGAIAKFKSDKAAEAQQIRSADDEFMKELAKRAENERLNIAGQIVETDLAIRVGKKTGGSEPIIWAPTDKTYRLSNQHILIVGKSGSGKTQGVKYLVSEMRKRNSIPTLICDFHGEYAASAGGDDFQKNTNAVVLDAAEGIDLNPLAIQVDPITGKPNSFIFAAYQVSNALAKVFKLGPIQESYLKNAIVNAFQNVGFDPKDFKTWTRTPPPFSAVWDELIVLESVYGSSVSNLLSRVEPLFETRVFQGSQGSMAQFFTKGQVSIIRLSSLPSDKLRIAVSQFLLQKVYELMLVLGPTPRQRLFLIVEEAHLLAATEKLTSMLKESRKYGIGTLLSSQEPRDFSQSILSNAGTIISLQLEAEDAKLMSRFLGVTNSKAQMEVMDRLMRLSPGQALLRNNRYTPYVPVTLNPYYLAGAQAPVSAPKAAPYRKPGK